MASIGGFIRTLKVIWQFGDALAPLLEQLVSALPAAGQGMIDGGSSAVVVSRAIKRQGGLPVNAQKTVEDVAAAIQQSRQHVIDAAGRVRSAADNINQVTVPTVTPTMIVLPLPVSNPLDPDGKWRVVGGLNTSSTAPFQPVHDGLDLAAAQLDNVASQLNLAVSGLNGLAAALENAGSNLSAMGQSMQQGGQALKQLED